MSNTDYNQHLYNAVKNVQDDAYVIIGSDKIEGHFPGLVAFTVQSGPVAEAGRNGCDATDIIRYAIGLYRSFNNAHGCRENSLTITHLEEALHWQEARTRDRMTRAVEGTNQD